jgi:hypothetical protein
LVLQTAADKNDRANVPGPEKRIPLDGHGCPFLVRVRDTRGLGTNNGTVITGKRANIPYHTCPFPGLAAAGALPVAAILFWAGDGGPLPDDSGGFAAAVVV